jgi:hypothetical protein
MRAAAGDLSAALRDTHTAVQWDELAAKPDSPDLLWRRARRVGPQVLRVLRPLLAGEPATAFMIDPAAETKADGRADKKPAPRKRATRK